MAPKPDPILRRFKAALDSMCGSRIDRVVLFGSRACGDAPEDSDHDVAVFLKSLDDRREELDRLAGLRVRLLEETGAVFDAKPYLARAQEVLRVSTGIEVKGGVLALNPRLPAEMECFEMCVRYRGHSLELRLTRDALAIRGSGPDVPSISLSVAGRICESLAALRAHSS